MKTMVGYLSQTGNTKKVAEAIYETIQGDKTIANLNQISNLEDYDLVFIGFPIVQMGPPASVASILKEKCAGKKTAIFATHGAPLNLPPLQAWLQKCRDAAEHTELLGLFSCQGEVSQKVRDLMNASGDPQLQMFAKMAVMADGQPNEASLVKAQSFAQEIMEAL